MRQQDDFKARAKQAVVKAQEDGATALAAAEAKLTETRAELHTLQDAHKQQGELLRIETGVFFLTNLSS